MGPAEAINYKEGIVSARTFFLKQFEMFFLIAVIGLAQLGDTCFINRQRLFMSTKLPAFLNCCVAVKFTCY